MVDDEFITLHGNTKCNTHMIPVTVRYNLESLATL